MNFTSFHDPLKDLWVPRLWVPESVIQRTKIDHTRTAWHALSTWIAHVPAITLFSVSTTLRSKIWYLLSFAKLVQRL